jgi:Membrane protein implicated in regulation of membrane protease activity
MPFPMSIVWLVAAVVFAVTEAATLGLTAIWFSAGSLVAMVAAMLGAQVWLQIMLFIVVSGVVVVLSRDWAKRFVNDRHVKTNADQIVGREAVVILSIDNDNAQGQIRVSGQVWTARAAQENTIEEGTHVVITAIEGVKAMVVRKAIPTETTGTIDL